MPTTTTTARPTTPAPRGPGRQRRGSAPEPTPLGSLTQRSGAPVESCASCGSASVTTLSITLTDGTPARFASCRSCGHRAWADDDGALSIGDVLVRTAKP